MKELKEYIITENNFFKNLGIGLQPQIKEWLDKNGIVNYTINKDLTIDVFCVILKNYPEEELPDYIRFNKVFSMELHNCPRLKSIVFPNSLNNFIVINCPKFAKIEKGDDGKGECLYRMIIIDGVPFKKQEISKSVKFGKECNQILLNDTEFCTHLAEEVVKIYKRKSRNSNWFCSSNKGLQILYDLLLNPRPESCVPFIDIIRSDDWIYDEFSTIYNIDSFYIGNYISTHNSQIESILKNMLKKDYK